MFEHVGKKFYRAFESINKLLKEDEYVCCTQLELLTSLLLKQVYQSIYFPGGICPSLSQIIQPLEETGLIVSDCETLISHDKTLEAWLERFLAKKNIVKDLFDEKFVKMWGLSS